MARRTVYIEMPVSCTRAWFRTDLRGHGQIRIGEEFTARECHAWGTQKLVKRGTTMRVRVTQIVLLAGRLDLLSVEILWMKGRNGD